MLINTERGLGAKDTQAPRWYDLLDPLFSLSVNDMVSISIEHALLRLRF